MVAIYRTRNCLILGDSLGRRLSATLATLLLVGSETGTLESFPNTLMEDKHVLGLGHHKGIAFALPEGTGHLTFKWTPLLVDLRAQLTAIDTNVSTTNKYTDIVICVGTHDSQELITELETIQKSIQDILQLVDKIAREQNIRVIWRTAPYRWSQDGVTKSPHSLIPYDEPKFSMDVNERIVKINAFVRQYALTLKGLSKTMTALTVFIMEFGREMAPRTIGAERVENTGGDTKDHFNIYGRMVCVQMSVYMWYFVDSFLFGSVCSFIFFPELHVLLVDLVRA